MYTPLTNEGKEKQSLNRNRSSRKSVQGRLGEQRLCIPEVGGVEALGEPTVTGDPGRP